MNSSRRGPVVSISRPHDRREQPDGADRDGESRRHRRPRPPELPLQRLHVQPERPERDPLRHHQRKEDRPQHPPPVVDPRRKQPCDHQGSVPVKVAPIRHWPLRFCDSVYSHLACPALRGQAFRGLASVLHRLYSPSEQPRSDTGTAQWHGGIPPMDFQVKKSPSMSCFGRATGDFVRQSSSAIMSGAPNRRSRNSGATYPPFGKRARSAIKKIRCSSVPLFCKWLNSIRTSDLPASFQLLMASSAS